MAINRFLVTLGAIALLLLYLMATETYYPAVVSIMTGTCLMAAVLIGIYTAYRVAADSQTQKDCNSMRLRLAYLTLTLASCLMYA